MIDWASRATRFLSSLAAWRSLACRWIGLSVSVFGRVGVLVCRHVLGAAVFGCVGVLVYRFARN